MSTTRTVTTLVGPAAVRSASIKGTAVAHAGTAVIVASSGSTVVALFDAEDPGTVPLDVAVWKFVLVHRAQVRSKSASHMKSRCTDVMDASLGVGM
jgi:hypothetical protein